MPDYQVNGGYGHEPIQQPAQTGTDTDHSSRDHGWPDQSPSADDAFGGGR